MAAEDSKPAVLIVGGLGFIGRHLAKYIHENGLASEMRIVDKVLPQLAYLAPEFEEACKDRFVQADASREQSMSRIFDRANGQQFDYVFNCAGDNRSSLDAEVYKKQNLSLSVTLGKEAAKRGIKAFVEASTALIYKSSSSPCKETDKEQPWGKLAEYKHEAEKELRKIPDLNAVALRFPYVYGEYDRRLVAIAVCLARTNEYLGTELEMLDTKDLKINTLHVLDAARAMWTAAEWRAKQGPGNEPFLFNVVDATDTNQGHLADALTSIFNIKVTFTGSLATMLAKLTLDDIIDDINEVSLQGWADLLAEKQITRPGPINPFIERDIFNGKDLCIDGSLFQKTTGFTLERPTFNVDALREMIASYERMGWWPK
ncbi:hypothetical protein VTN49DRAFT_4586 [Thermomyces lanuginosus]|uniref:uncharacterized protein n=1 Tax=Thermomyces lanuginosus TaxID=5541 RepID=UPI0037428563